MYNFFSRSDTVFFRTSRPDEKTLLGNVADISLLVCVSLCGSVANMKITRPSISRASQPSNFQTGMAGFG